MVETAMQPQILLVEDDDRARMLLAGVLRSAGYEVTVAANGEIAIALLDQHGFDVVVSDIWMPSVDGIGVLAAARSRPRPPAVILLTGYSTVESAVAALRSGAFDYRMKAAPITELLESIGRAVAQRRAELDQKDAITAIANGLAKLQREHVPSSPAPVVSATEDQRYLQAGALMIDRHRHEVTFNHQPLHLTTIEYTALLCLAEAQGQVVQYRDIIQRTHGYSTSNIEAQTLLKAHVHHLRRKIDPSYIINVRGTGYALAVPDTGS